MNNPITQSFIDGIAYFWGVGDNPIEKYYEERKAKNEGLESWEIDARNLRRDWERVGMYINNAMGYYEHETAETK
ncbi:MAG: hypothetical protein FWH18_08405 [Marinilabiliaceae bacterium]|nr:hypothetical protein [Marinilabiliaceae bacterium]